MASFVYLPKLEKHLESLKVKSGELEAMEFEVSTRDRREEWRGRRKLDSVHIWSKRVTTLVKEANELLDLAQDGTSWDLISKFKYGKKVYKKLRDVETHISQGEFEFVAERILPAVLVGQEETLSKIRQEILSEEDGVGFLGLYGVAGVGKTSLLRRFYNEVSSETESPFDLMMWFGVCKDDQRVFKIQNQIGKRLNLSNPKWKRDPKARKAMDIDYALQAKRFLFVFDHLSKELDLSEIGIPLPTNENGCIVIIASRSKDVVEASEVNPSIIEIKSLQEDVAWNLFRRSVGDTTLQSHQEILRLARTVFKQCRGVPLALQAVGAAMASQTRVQEWQHVVKVLTDQNMDDAVFSMLKLCFYALESDQTKLCLLSCALFPQDQEIRKEELVELWIGQGIVDVVDRGYEIISILVAKCFFIEAGDSKEMVKMHPIIWNLALSVGEHGLPKTKDQRNVRGISLRSDNIDFDCPKLGTLFLRKTKLKTISPEFLPRFPALLALDMSSNKYIHELPETISELVLLRYLNLSSTGLRRLPDGLLKLRKLMTLNLEHTIWLRDIKGISALTNIIVLRLCDSGFQVNSSVVNELELLDHLQFITITLTQQDVVQQFFSSPKLSKCAQGLYFDFCLISSPISITAFPSRTRCISVLRSKITRITVDQSGTLLCNLREVSLVGCSGLRDLTWLLFAPNLATLRVVEATHVEEIIRKDIAISCSSARLDMVPFQKLELLVLEGLGELSTIYWEALTLAELREIKIRSCPHLRKLPVNSASALGHTLVISAEKEWMQKLEWEDEETKQRLFPN